MSGQTNGRVTKEKSRQWTSPPGGKPQQGIEPKSDCQRGLSRILNEDLLVSLPRSALSRRRADYQQIFLFISFSIHLYVFLLLLLVHLLPALPIDPRRTQSVLGPTGSRITQRVASDREVALLHTLIPSPPPPLSLEYVRVLVVPEIESLTRIKFPPS